MVDETEQTPRSPLEEMEQNESAYHADVDEETEEMTAAAQQDAQQAVEDGQNGLEAWVVDALQLSNDGTLDLGKADHQKLIGKANNDMTYEDERDLDEQDGNLSPAARAYRRKMQAQTNRDILTDDMGVDDVYGAKDQLPSGMQHELFGEEVYDPVDVEERVNEAESGARGYTDEQVAAVRSELDEMRSDVRTAFEDAYGESVEDEYVEFVVAAMANDVDPNRAAFVAQYCRDEERSVWDLDETEFRELSHEYGQNDNESVQVLRNGWSAEGDAMYAVANSLESAYREE